MGGRSRSSVLPQRRPYFCQPEIARSHRIPRSGHWLPPHGQQGTTPLYAAMGRFAAGSSPPRGRDRICQRLIIFLCERIPFDKRVGRGPRCIPIFVKHIKTTIFVCAMETLCPSRFGGKHCEASVIRCYSRGVIRVYFNCCYFQCPYFLMALVTWHFALHNHANLLFESYIFAAVAGQTAPLRVGRGDFT